MNELALFTGAGGGLLAGRLLGWTPVAACEIEPSARDMLLARQRDGILPPFPIWDDVQSFNGHPWRGIIDIISGGFPCQDISPAGGGEGLEGERSRLWTEMYRIIREVRPRFAFVENSPMLTLRGLDRVLGDLAESGYDAAWTVLSAAALGAPHRRERLWLLAEDVTNTDGQRREEQWWPWPEAQALTTARRSGWWSSEPAVGRVADGMARRVDRLRAIGNGQVPLVAAVAFKHLFKSLKMIYNYG